MKKKAAVLGSLVLSFSVALFATASLGACKQDDLEKQRAESRAELETYFTNKMESNYSEDNWDLMEDLLHAGQNSIEIAKDQLEIETVVNTTKNNMDNIVKDEVGQNFSLIIETESILYRKNDDINFDIKLKNQSGKDLEISYYFLFTPIIPTASNEPVPTEMPSEPYRREFKKGEVISSRYNLGGYFDFGQHEIKFKASFYLGDGQGNEPIYEMVSNVIAIIVTES